MSQNEVTDTDRIEFLQSMGAGKWIARRSMTGRGYRLHNDQFGFSTVREAIDNAMAIERQERKNA